MSLPMLGGIMGKTIADKSELTQLEYVAVAKAGDDTNSGESNSEAVLTLARGIDIANGKSPSISNPIFVHLIDGGVYDIGAVTKTLSQYVYVVGPAASLDASVSGKSIVFSDHTGMRIHNIYRSASGFTIQKIAGSGDAFVEISGEVSTGDYGFINMDAGSLHVEFKTALTSGGTNPSFIQALDGSVYIKGNYINNTAAVGWTFRAESDAIFYIDVKEIHATDKWLQLENISQAYVTTSQTSGTLVTAATTTYRVFNLSSIEVGNIEGFVLKYNSTTAVTITSGWADVNYINYIQDGDAVHTLTSLDVDYANHYIYIDHSASTPLIPDFIDSTTEPVWDDIRQGWYNGADRCIGSVASTNGAATILYFETVGSQKNIRYKYARAALLLSIATNMNPDGTWQTPNDNETSGIVPENATSIYLFGQARDVGQSCVYAALSSERAAFHPGTTQGANGEIYDVGHEVRNGQGNVTLGVSRNIKVAGANDDDNSLSFLCGGFETSR